MRTGSRPPPRACRDTHAQQAHPHQSPCHPEALRNNVFGRQNASSRRRVSRSRAADSARGATRARCFAAPPLPGGRTRPSGAAQHDSAKGGCAVRHPYGRAKGGCAVQHLYGRAKSSDIFGWISRHRTPARAPQHRSGRPLDTRMPAMLHHCQFFISTIAPCVATTTVGAGTGDERADAGLLYHHPACRSPARRPTAGTSPHGGSGEPAPHQARAARSAAVYQHKHDHRPPPSAKSSDSKSSFPALWARKLLLEKASGPADYRLSAQESSRFSSSSRSTQPGPRARIAAKRPPRLKSSP